jgi:hypothetical protein
LDFAVIANSRYVGLYCGMAWTPRFVLPLIFFFLGTSFANLASHASAWFWAAVAVCFVAFLLTLVWAGRKSNEISWSLR